MAETASSALPESMTDRETTKAVKRLSLSDRMKVRTGFIPFLISTTLLVLGSFVVILLTSILLMMLFQG